MKKQLFVSSNIQHVQISLSGVHLKFYFLLFLILGTSLSYAQNWLWGRQGKAPNEVNGCGRPFTSSSTASANNNAFITGQYADNLILGNDTLSGGSIFLAKYNSNGILMWAFSSIDSLESGGYSKSVSTDKNGNVYITGYFNGSLQFGALTLRSIPNNIGGNFDLFLAKFDSNGNALWVRQGIEYSRFDNVEGLALATDESGNILVAGDIADTVSFGTYTFRTPNEFYLEPILLKYDSNGNILWGKQGILASSSSSAVEGSITTDKMNNIYISGEFSDTISFDTYTLVTIVDTNMNTYLVKYSPSGNVLWAKQSENAIISNPDGETVTTDQADNSYISGVFLYNAQFGSYNLNTIDESVFLTKYDSAGNVLWAKQPISSGWICNSIASDASHIYLGGNSSTSPPTILKCGSDTLYSNSWVYMAAYVMKFDTAGNPICGSILNNLGACSISCDSTGTYLYIAGTFANDTIICGPDILIDSSGIGGNSIFVGRWQNCAEDAGIDSKVTPNIHIVLYPNPNNGIFTLSFSPPELVSGSQTIEVYNMLGEKIYDAMLNQAQHDEQINLSAYPNGIYLYRISNQQNIISSGKFIIQK